MREDLRDLRLLVAVRIDTLDYFAHFLDHFLDLQSVVRVQVSDLAIP